MNIAILDDHVSPGTTKALSNQNSNFKMRPCRKTLSLQVGNSLPIVRKFCSFLRCCFLKFIQLKGTDSYYTGLDTTVAYRIIKSTSNSTWSFPTSISKVQTFDSDLQGRTKQSEQIGCRMGKALIDLHTYLIEIRVAACNKTIGGQIQRIHWAKIFLLYNLTSVGSNL